ncbi:MAG: thiamine phosphate synthase [Verrucomicrobia bacterium]|nr:thiamine phosphate synthase [Verrucomicrobiota bacterium]
MKPLADCRLYTFVDSAYLHGRDPVELARQLCAGGSDLLQLRAKDSAPDDIKRLAEKILPVCAAAGVALVINDHPALAREVGAPYCHLGQEDFFDAGHLRCAELPMADGKWQIEERTPTATTSAIGHRPSAIRLGLSTRSPAQALRAIAAGPDYLAIGPVFATPTKPGRPAVTLDYVRWAAANVALPWFAIGGITLGNVDAVLAAGARRICVVSAILDAPDVAKACGEFRARLEANS